MMLSQTYGNGSTGPRRNAGRHKPGLPLLLSDLRSNGAAPAAAPRAAWWVVVLATPREVGLIAVYFVREGPAR